MKQSSLSCLVQKDVLKSCHLQDISTRRKKKIKIKGSTHINPHENSTSREESFRPFKSDFPLWNSLKVWQTLHIHHTQFTFPLQSVPCERDTSRCMTYCSFPKTLGGAHPLLTKAVGFLRFLSWHNRSSADGDAKRAGCLPSHMANTAKKATPRAQHHGTWSTKNQPEQQGSSSQPVSVHKQWHQSSTGGLQGQRW